MSRRLSFAERGRTTNKTPAPVLDVLVLLNPNERNTLNFVGAYYRSGHVDNYGLSLTPSFTNAFLGADSYADSVPFDALVEGGLDLASRESQFRVPVFLRGLARIIDLVRLSETQLSEMLAKHPIWTLFESENLLPPPYTEETLVYDLTPGADKRSVMGTVRDIHGPL